MTKGWRLTAKGWRLTAIGLFVAAAMALLAPSSNAQITVVNMVGSSAAFNALGLAAEDIGGTTPVCGTNNWTLKGGGQGNDARSGSISAVTGNIWVVWNGSSTGSGTTLVCTYLNIDSIVGVRLFAGRMASGTQSGTLTIPAGCTGQAGSSPSLVPLFPADVNLPVNVCTALNGAVFAAAVSDVRAEDAQFETTRALASCSTPTGCGPVGNGLGYGPSPIGVTLNDGFGAGKAAQVVAFNLLGKDPITNGTLPTLYDNLNVGAQTLMVIVNNTQTGTGHFGNSAFNNVARSTLANYFDGSLTRTCDMVPGVTTCFPTTVLHREPTSGTYTTFEFCIVGNKENASWQERNICPASGVPTGWTGAVSPALNITCVGTGGSKKTCDVGAQRIRVIGTGQMVTEIKNAPHTGFNANADTIGYAFWSFGNFSGVTTAKYITVDGIDPIQATYTGGSFPSCTPPCAGTLTFPNVVNGGYPIWNVLRVITTDPASSTLTSLVTTAYTEVLQVPDFVPFNSLSVFRSHYPGGGIATAHDGFDVAFSSSTCSFKNISVSPNKCEQGGDVGGAVFAIQADLDFFTDTAKELTGKHQ